MKLSSKWNCVTTYQARVKTRMNKKYTAARDHCIRCGECCLGSSPALHRDDIPLIREGKIPKTLLYTLRRGEAVKDNVNERFTTTQDEMIKIKEREGEQAGCAYYDHQGNACTIYEKRPTQCAALECWDTKAFMRVFSCSSISLN